ncbi:hypothetical protein NDU88_007900 [Pleurodeles waltl]|uniref:Uncharacterized protein n=1 Tax=Pleurodeles waltl TaxID=8319 RepID=A0AAV7RW70_PLEWA|nr:hypothetical protein NDU88_007900 [Pleurodeles waltl]
MEYIFRANKLAVECESFGVRLIGYGSACECQGQSDVLGSVPDPGAGTLVGRAHEGWGPAHPPRRLRVE